MDEKYSITIHDNGSGERVNIIFDDHKQLYMTGDGAENLACKIFDAISLFRAKAQEVING